jgi:hypothetical protein
VLGLHGFDEGDKTIPDASLKGAVGVYHAQVAKFPNGLVAPNLNDKGPF